MDDYYYYYYYYYYQREKYFYRYNTGKSVSISFIFKTSLLLKLHDLTILFKNSKRYKSLISLRVPSSL